MANNLGGKKPCDLQALLIIAANPCFERAERAAQNSEMPLGKTSICCSPVRGVKTAALLTLLIVIKAELRGQRRSEHAGNIRLLGHNLL